jgi:SnoaL-like domain
MTTRTCIVNMCSLQANACQFSDRPERNGGQQHVEANRPVTPSEKVLAIWRDIDHNDGRQVHEWFEPDGILTFGREAIQGRADIAATYFKRRDGTGRVGRHVATNLVEERVDEQTVRVISLVVLFAGNGTPPLPQLVPQFVGDVEDILVRDGADWLVRSRTLTPIFFSPDVPLAVPMR